MARPIDRRNLLKGVAAAALAPVLGPLAAVEPAHRDLIRRSHADEASAKLDHK